MAFLIRELDNFFYPNHSSNWDDRLLRQRVLSHLRPEHVMLDLGAGAGIVEAMNFRGLCSKVVGIDLDPRVAENPFLDEGHVASGEILPFAEDSFDLVISDNVLEHLSKPEQVFSEIARVLKPGGVFLAKTPNRWHYMPMIAQLTPTQFHRWFNRLRGRNTIDTFPTRYRANSSRSVSRLAQDAGLLVENIELVEGRPEYLRFHALPYLVGIAYERLVNLSPLLHRFRIVLLCDIRKPQV